MSIDYRERRLRFWCQKVLPLVYDESLSYYELLCKIMKHLSEAETDVSALEQWLAELDAEAVKKVYSEWPLVASKEGNVITLSNTRARDIVTNVTGADGSPITVTESTNGTNGHLDPDDESSPTGLVNLEKSMVLDINEATTETKGAMSASDKTKLDALHEVKVQGGSSGNIQVGSSTVGYNRTYTVELNPNFAPTMMEWSLTGNEWEWNAGLNGGVEQVMFSSSPYPQHGYYATFYGDNINPTWTNSQKQRLAIKGYTEKRFATEQAGENMGYGFTADANYPFANIEPAASVVDGETYFTTTNSVRVKAQLTGSSVANRDYTIYLTLGKPAGNSSPANTYLTHGDYFYPTTSTSYMPVKYTAHTDANGYFDVTIPSGLTAIAYQTNQLPSAATGAVQALTIVAAGDPAELYGTVKIDTIKVAILAALNE